MLKNICLFIFMMFLSLTMLAQTVSAADLPILVEREEKISAVFPQSDTKLWMVTDKGLFEFDTKIKKIKIMVDTDKSSQFIASSVTLGFGAYTIREKKKDGTYIYHIYDGDVIHDISSKLFINRLDYCKSAQMVFFEGYTDKEEENHQVSMFTDMAGKPNIDLSKRLVQDLIIIPVDQDPSFKIGRAHV